MHSSVNSVSRRSFGRVVAAGIVFPAAFGCVDAAAHDLDELTFITEDYPPLNFERDGRRQGIAVDLLVEMFKTARLNKASPDIKVWPWARGYETALREKNVVLFSTVRTEAREHLFKWVGPIMPSRIVLVAKKKRRIRVADSDELKHSSHRIGVVREDIGGQLLDKLGVSKERTLQANTGVSLAKLLHLDRVDMWAYGAEVILWNLKELGYPTADYEEVFTLADAHSYYFALNKSTDDRLVAELQTALDRVKAKGRLGEIIRKYC